MNGDEQRPESATAEPEELAPAAAAKAMRFNQSAFTTFNGPVHVDGVAAFGIANAVSGSGAHRLEGQVPPGVIRDACDKYARPESYAFALKALRSDRVIVLYGPRGSGKQTGALNLTRELGDDRALIMLRHDQTLEDLAKRDYRSGAAYLVLGWSGADADSDGVDVAILALAEKIQGEEGTHLIITSERPISALVAQFHWERPTLESILCAYDVREVEVDREVLEEHSLADLVLFARNLADGMDPQTSLGGLDLANRRKVVAWFDSEPTPHELLEVAALAFLNGLPENKFEPWFERLAAAIIPPPTEAEGPLQPKALSQTRKRDERSLITVVKRAATSPEAIPGQTRRCVEFKSPSFRVHVIAELCGRYPEKFWRPLFGWLNEIIRTPDPEVRDLVTYGLALLAAHDFDSVREEFLQPWSAGEYGLRAWTAAANVLSYMCFDDTVAPLAHRTAIRWSRSEKVLRRCAAAFAFSHAVGVLYPADALRHLWPLSERSETAENGAAAIVLLYVTLTTAGTGDNKVVLKDLISRMRWLRQTDMARLGHTIDIAVNVLGVQLEERSVSAEHLRAQSADAPIFGELWALSVVNRPRRRAVFAAIFDILAEIDDGDEDLPGAAITALRAALPVHERRPFAVEFVRYAMSRAPEDTPRFVSRITSTFKRELR
ncbi:hypothetical protein [Acrocarpospora catenulata]|uniref:hypothetical protein n=1 Tax=Acrocarpospora catenulata TaxID=2836182 RepID=UPI001BD920FD|nr:hypothetical protein [Acrocarpospora catenulata]